MVTRGSIGLGLESVAVGSAVLSDGSRVWHVEQTFGPGGRLVFFMPGEAAARALADALVLCSGAELELGEDDGGVVVDAEALAFVLRAMRADGQG